MKTFSFKKSPVPLYFTLVMLGFLGFMAFLPPKENADTLLARIILLSLAFLCILFYYRSQTSKLVLSPTELQIFGDVTNYTVQVGNLQLEQIRTLDLRLEPKLHAAFRTWGTGLPKYATGHFTLANEQEAFIFVSDDARVVYIPTTKGKDLLLSLEQPEAFIAALKEVHANT